MSESAPDLDGPDEVDLDDIDLDDYEQLTPAAQQAWLRYATVALIKREKRNNDRISRGEKQRKSIFVVAVCLLVISLAALLVASYAVWSSGSKTEIRNKQFNDTQQQLRTIVCAIPPGTDARFDGLRSESRCGPYMPIASSSSGVPFVPTRTVTATPPPPSASPTIERPAQPRASRAAASTTGPSRSVVVRTPAPRTTTVTPAPAPQPSTSPTPTPGLVPDLLCTLLGCSPSR